MSRVLVIGSVHIDVIVSVEPNMTDNLDKIGRLNYSVGGTAFNVAANLAFHKQDVGLYSFLKSDGFSTETIRNEIKKRGLDSNYIREISLPVEGGFVAHIQNGVLNSAVSCTNIQDVNLDDEDLKGAISGCKLVALSLRACASAEAS